MEVKNSSSRLWITSIVGAVLGYGLLHPYAIYIYKIFKERGSMMVMGLPFALVGALAGLLLGLWLLNKNKKEKAEKLVERLENQLSQYEKENVQNKE